MIELKEPPKDLSHYVKASERKTFEEYEMNLRGLIKQKTANILAAECPLATITNLEAELIESEYVIQFVQIQGMTSFADFYLERFAAPK